MSRFDPETVRRRVLGPDETEPTEDFYLERPGHAPVNMTALREAERRFKSKNYAHNLKEALDFSNLNDDRIRLVGSIPDDLSSWMLPGAPIYEVDCIPGFKFVHKALSEEQQAYWLYKSFGAYMKWPNQTNLDAVYTGLPQEGLYNSREEFLKVMKGEVELNFRRMELFRKIRWTTLGYQYNWTTKAYDFDKAPVAFPPELFEWSHKAAEATGFGPDYRAEAGIVNYYQLDDTLTGHVDRSEPNMDAPLLSMSLGHSCVFILGGKDRNDPVTPILLRSGDVSILSGESRQFYHGVPRILPDTLPEHLARFEAIRNARVNINIRQVT